MSSRRKSTDKRQINADRLRGRTSRNWTSKRLTCRPCPRPLALSAPLWDVCGFPGTPDRPDCPQSFAALRLDFALCAPPRRLSAAGRNVSVRSLLDPCAHWLGPYRLAKIVGRGVIKSLRVTLGSQPRDPTLSIHPIVNVGLACETRDFSGFCAGVFGDDSPVAFRVTDWFETHFYFCHAELCRKVRKKGSSRKHFGPPARPTPCPFVVQTRSRYIPGHLRSFPIITRFGTNDHPWRKTPLAFLL